MKSVRVHPAPILRGTLQVPGDKSISHRAVMLSALAKGTSILRGLLMGEDVQATMRCFQAMGVPIQVSPDKVVVQGVGLKGLKAPEKVLDCGNSGTTMRLMMGILAGQPFVSRLTGDASLNRRPMKRVIEPLTQMGADIQELRASETERVIKIQGRSLHGMDYRLPVASAQVKSAVLLAGLFATGTTRVREPVASRDHTEIMLSQKGAPLQRSSHLMELQGGAELKAADLSVPGDISSAAFFLVAGLLGPESEIHLTGVGLNPTRTGILKVLKDMGGDIEIRHRGQAEGEEVADLVSRGSALKATQVSGALIPRLIDEIPILCVAAAKARGRTEIQDAAELRVKETDRIQAAVTEFKKLSININELKYGMDVEGPANFHGGTFHSHGDHRMAMSLAIAATQAEGPSIIEDVECVRTSYPGFFEHLQALGAKVEWV